MFVGRGRRSRAGKGRWDARRRKTERNVSWASGYSAEVMDDKFLRINLLSQTQNRPFNRVVCMSTCKENDSTPLMLGIRFVEGKELVVLIVGLPLC